MVYQLHFNSLEVGEGYTLRTTEELIHWLCHRNYTVSYDFMKDAIISCAEELGCIFRDPYELEEDILRYYI